MADHKRSSETTLAISLIDHTLLGDKDTEDDIQKLVEAAVAEQPHVAAVCVYPKFIGFIRSLQTSDPTKYPKSLKIATVVNFPSGQEPLEKVVEDTKKAVADGADEIDMVIDYKLLREDLKKGVANAEWQVQKVREVCEGCILKVIIESGELQKSELISAATRAACVSKADFVKTSTGKVPVNATPEHSSVMLKTIDEWNKDATREKVVGFKVAGGVRTAEQAKDYMLLTAKMLFGSDAAFSKLTSENLRFGSSGLLRVLREELRGHEEDGDAKKKQRVDY
eukprot:TRINITY_DN51640_c0_g1_i1.p1 TRINITY_DN51640_c0_g1~~TRINITY_DN51640_c0_g1_i1.p1  ORF type:complete len:318 (-),score=88.90 TRINITY_DN51640_c0_g1_i1:90-932(-)